MNFQYKARDSAGVLQEGTIEASNGDEAAKLLRGEGLTVYEMVEAEDDGPGLFPKSVSRNEIVYFTNQLAVMVDTGITLASALQGILEQEKNPTLKAALKELKKSVEGGEDFSVALAKFPRYFDKTYISLIKASEATGSLGEMLQRIADYLRKELETRGKVRASMAYPGIMLFLAIAVTLFLLVFILPQFTPMFKSKGIKLPTATIVMMAISDALLGYWWAWIGGGAAIVGGIIYGKRTEPGRKIWDRMMISLPLLGVMNRKVVISRSIRTLGTMLSSGIPMLESLRLSSEVSGNYWYEELWKDVATQVTSGAQVCDSLRGNPLFPPMLIQMISAGEQTGRLGPILERVSNYYDSEVDVSLKSVTSMIEPLMITVMGGVVGSIGMALLLPIFKLSSARG
jgi:type IV pilus assembly protein PilC